MLPRPNLLKLSIITEPNINILKGLHHSALLEKLQFLPPEHLFLCPSNQALSTHQKFSHLKERHFGLVVKKKHEYSKVEA